MLIRIFKYSIKNILRNKFLSISSILVLTLLMFFINILILVHDVSIKLVKSINSKLTISLYLEEWYNKNNIEVIDLIENIKKISSNDTNKIIVQYKTKEEIIKDIILREPSLVKILEKNNPLPETIEIKNIDLKQYSKLNSVIENKSFLFSKEDSDVKYFASYNSQYKKITSIIEILSLLLLWLYIIIAIFLISISIIIYSIIWNFIYYFRHEIYITRLVWGSKSFIYWPFILQWSIYSFLAFLLNLVIFIIFFNNINSLFEYIYSFNFSTYIYIIEMFIFVLIWGLSWYLSSKKYLK